MLVHFFSSKPSYLLHVAALKLSPRSSSSRNAVALLDRLVEVRYAIMDLFLVSSQYVREREGGGVGFGNGRSI